MITNPPEQLKRAALLRRLQQHKSIRRTNRTLLPILPADRKEPLPLSWAQQRLWFLDRLDHAAGAAYHIPAALRLSGQLNQGALQAALDRIVARHESLRTTFVSVEGTPTQVIAPAGIGFALLHRDLSNLEGSAQEAAVAELAAAEGSQSFDLVTGPLIRGQLLHLAMDEHVLLVTQHHIISDGWSIGVLVRELSALYSAFSQGESDPLPELAIQYADYAVWQRQWLKGEVLQKQIDFWREHLGGAPALLELPTDRARPAEQSYKGGSVPVTLPAELTAGLRDLSQRHETTLFMTLLGGWSVLLSRLSGQGDVVIGTPMANRQRSEIESLIGFFVNTLALRVQLEEDPSVARLLEQIKGTMLGAYAHQDLPFEQVVEALQPERSLSHSALFQATLVLNNVPTGGTLTLPGLRLAAVEIPRTTTQFDLILSLSDAGERIVGSLEYATDLFDASTVERMTGYFVTLLSAMVKDETQRISQLPLLSAAQRRQLLVEFNATESQDQSDRLVHELFEEQAASAPDATALVYEEERLSYGELNRRANQVSHHLIGLGVRPDDRVAICVERSLEMVVGLLGILKAGGAYVPLDPNYPNDRLAYMLQDGTPVALLTQSKLQSKLEVLAASIRKIPVMVFDREADAAALVAQPEHNPDPLQIGLTSRHLAYVIYTSGSTGRPKGVMISTGSFANHICASIIRYKISSNDRVLQFASMSFDPSLEQIFSSLAVGATLILRGQELWSPKQLSAELGRHAVTVANIPPSYSTAVIGNESVMIPSLRLLIIGGDALLTETVKDGKPTFPLMNAYGPTETTITATTFEVSSREQLAGIQTQYLPIGRPVANMQIYILDTHLQPVPIGVSGEIYIGGVGVARGYLNRPNLTTERFIADPFGAGPEGRLYKTGDLGRWLPDGNVEYLGRNDLQVKIRGLRIELGEIEARLVEHPGVREAVVIAREDHPAEKRLVAYVVPEKLRQLELWPSVGEHLIYDDLLYYAMTNDDRRNDSYKVAINRAVRDKIVVEIGTGKDAILARFCVEAGARKVYAIELLEETYHKAKALIEELGLQDRIILIHGDAMQVELPEEADVCVSEIVGPIGGCEGAGVLINNARRFMKEESVMIPERATTRIAAVTLPTAFLEDPAFTETSARYVDKIFESRGYKFDFRLCLRGLRKDDLISTVGIFEDLDHIRCNEVEYQRDEQITITRASRIDGLLVWLNLYTAFDQVIDILEHEHCWLPVYCPVFYPGIDVAEGDTIQMTITSRLPEGRINPDYNLKGCLNRQDGNIVPFDYNSDYATNAFKQTPFYEMLFRDGTPRVKSSEQVKLPGSDLRGYLDQRLPDYMVPTAYVHLDSLPLTPNGKINRRALPAPAHSARITRGYEAPTGELEVAIAGVWEELLGLDQVGRHDHFFELGGHSMLVISLAERLRGLGIAADERMVFVAPTLAGLAAAVVERKGPALSFSVPPNRITPDCTAITPEMLPLVSLTQGEIDQIIAKVPGGVANIQDIYPLAPLQEGILFHHLLEKEGDAYLLRTILAFDSRSRLDAFLSALQVVIERHDILRSAVSWQGLSQSVQVVSRQASLPVEELTLTGEENALAQLRSVTDPRHLRLDLQRAPLLAAYVSADPHSGEWLLSLLVHHMMSDHVTLELMLSEIQLLLLGQREHLPEPLPYRNFVAQAHRVTPEEHESYFRQRLGDVDEPTAPFGLINVQEDGSRVEEAQLSLSNDLAQQIRGSAREQGVTPAMLFHVAWAQVLARCSGRDDVVFGTVLSGRQHGSEGTERVLGMFINTLPLRISLGTVSVRQAVHEAYQRLNELLEHEQASLALAQRCSGVMPPLPLFTSLLNYRHSRGASTGEGNTAAALAWEGIRLLDGEERTNYPLAVSVDDLGQGFALTAQCVGGIDATRIVNYLARAIGELVEALGTAPEQPAYRLNILPESEFHQLLVAFNATEADYPSDGLIHALFEDQAARTPEATALVFEEDGLSYGELNRRANQVAHHLIGLGISPDDRVAICMERSLEMVVGLLGILKAGGAYVPLDPSYPEERLAYMLDDSAPVALLTQTTLRDRFAKFKSHLLVVDGADDLLLLARQPQVNPDPMALGLGGSHLAYVIYTSGSTGLPKGVMNEHGGLCNLVLAQIDLFGVGLESRVLQFASFSFDASISEIMMALCSGATLHLGSRDALRPGKALLDTLQRHQITHVTLPSSVLQACAEEELPHSPLTLVVAGEVLPGALASRWASRHRLFNAYGPTEATVCATTYRCELGRDGPVPIGCPIANTQVYILDKHLEPVPLGVSGEIYIGGLGVARGYWNRQELTAERFITDPFSADSEARLYKTGDLGRWLPEGNIEYLGRNDFQVKIRGFRIELEEIEARLTACKGVRETVVIAREDTPGEKRLVAYVVPREGVELSALALREELSKALADYMVPSAFVSLETLPLMPNGKLDRRALPAPGQSAVITRGYEAPVGEIEVVIAQVWQELLGLERVGRHDHFFELGGHSLLAVQVVSRLRQRLGLEVALRELFTQPTLGEFAKAVAQAGDGAQPPLVRADRKEQLPLSWAQQRLWFLDRLDHAAGAAYHIPAALRLSGDLNQEALQAALNRIVARHESLRTTFVSVEETPTQAIAPAETGFALRHRDLSNLEGSAQEAAVAELAAAEGRQSFDLATGPLIRGQLVHLAKDEHVLLVTQHHIISDGWSIGVLVGELSALYSAFSQGGSDPLPELAIQYADYAVWQREWLEGEVLQKQIDFWREHLGGAPALLELPTDRPRPAEQSYKGSSVPVTLPAELTAGLRDLSQRHGTTLFMTLLGGWSVLLSRLSGQADVVIGTPVANRQRSEIESLIGFFVNTLALRVQLGKDLSVAQLLEQIKATMLGAYAHQDLPFEQVVEALQPERSLSHGALFQAMLVLNNLPSTGALTLPGLRLASVEIPRTTTQFDLTLSLSDAGESIVGSLEYATDLFDASTVERMMGYFVTLLSAIVEDQNQSVSQLPLLSPAQRRQLLVEFNASEGDYPSDGLIHELFAEQAARAPEATALVFEEERLSYGELNRRANQLAHHLIGLGVRPDDRVAICVEPSLEMMIGLVGILKAGAAYVPLDPSYPKERLAYMLEDSRPAALLTQTGLRHSLPSVESEVLLLDGTDDLLLLAQQPEANPDAEALGVTSSHLAYVIYTSGSTGMPKGVMVEHRNVARLFRATEEWFHFNAKDVWTLFHSFAFDFSVWEIWGALLYGGRLVVVPTLARRTPQEFYRLLCEEEVTILNQTPTAFRQLIAAQGQSDGSHRLRQIIFGGEALELHMLAPWIEQNEPERTRLINMYGITEITVHGTYREISAADVRGRRGSLVGKALPDLRIYLLDGRLEPVPVGVSGELYVGGAGVARGYLNRPELTAERFITDPFRADPEARLYKTGDLGRWLPDGNIEYLGRNDFQVKIRGFRIELGEIEARLAACAGVREAVVIAREDSPGQKRLVAYVVSQEGVELSAAALREELSKVLAEYMVPGAFVSLEALPLTANGKLDRQALPEPDQSAVITRGYESPAGEIEVAIAEVWQELLGLKRVGRHDHFFELGGHSLLVVNLIERLRERGFNAEVRMVFVAPTLAELAAAVVERKGLAPAFAVPPNRITPDCTRITPEMLPLVNLAQGEIDQIVAGVPGGAANIQDIYPLAPLQEGILFHHLLEDEGDAYLLRTILAFDSRNRLDAFVGALQAVIERHDILRSAVCWEGLTQPVQVVYRQAPLPVEELSLAPEGDALAELRAATDPRHLRLDLRRAPLLKAYVVDDRQTGEWLLAFLDHHIVTDNQSLQLLIKEIQLLLAGLGERLPIPLPYRNFIAHTHAISPEEHEKYFRAEFGTVTEPTAPFGLLNVQGDGTTVQEAGLTVNDVLEQRIREAARREGVTPAVLFHVAWGQVLGQCSGRDDVVFGTVLSGRLQGSEGADRVLGMFINTLPIRIRLGQVCVRQAVHDTHVRLGELLEHEQASLVFAQRCSGVASPMPLFTALLNYRHSNAAVVQDDAAATALAFAGMRLLGGEERTNYPLAASVDDLGQGFILGVQGITGIDPARVVSYFETAIAGLVEALGTSPEQPVHELNILPDKELHQLLVELNPTEAEYPSDSLIHTLFEEQVARAPGATALVFGERRLSYGELNRRANQVAHYLIELGIRPDDHVAICVERGLEMMAGVLGILKAGGAYVPLDPSYPKERLAYMLEDCAPKALLTQAGLRHGLPKVESHVVLLDHDQPTSELTRQPDHNPDPVVLGLTSAELAYVIYTSGSTGLPRGAMNIHRGIVNRLCWMQREYRLASTERVLHKTPLSFDVSVWEIFWALSAGATLVIAAPGGHRDPAYLAGVLHREKVNVAAFVPSLLKTLLNENVLPELPHLRLLFSGGEGLPASLATDFAHRFSRTSLVNLYGPSEASIGVTYWPFEPGHSSKISPIGRPISNVQLYILDAEHRLVPMGVSGELHIGGVAVGRGYYGQPQLTTEKFICNPFSTDPEARLYKTGDLARWLPDGNIEYLGRNDFQVKIRGFRIELGEIEARLATCSGVREAVVIAREDKPGEKLLAAYVVSQEGVELSAAALREELSKALADYMVPSAFVSLETLPLMPNGKLDRRALPAPGQSAVITRGYEAPVGAIEVVIAQVWQELLGLERVGRHDHFFELGGHSLLAVQVVSRLRQRLGVEVALRELFAQPTLGAFAKVVAQAGHGGQPPLLPADRNCALPLSWAQQRLWFLDRLDHAAGAAYHIPAALRLSGKLSQDALQAALDRIIVRHESLRTTFVSVEGTPTQAIAPAEIGFALRHRDLSSLEGAAQEAAVAELGAAEARQSFDLALGPLIRGQLLRLAEDEHVLLVTQHHIISDGWSIGVLVRELSALYNAFSQGEPDPLPELTIQYADYAVWQRQWLEGEVLQKQIDFWREHLAGAPALLELPTDRARPAEQSYKGSSVPVTLPAELTAGLRALSQRHGTTLFMTLLGGWSVLLSRLSGQTDVVIGTPVANRQRSEIESLIGFFVNTLALRVQLEGDLSVGQLLEQIKATTLGAYAHQDLPFEQVVEALQPERSLSHSALFQAMLVLNNLPSAGALTLSGLRLASVETPRITTQFDLTLSLSDAGERIVGSLEYATDLFDASTVERMMGFFVTVLSAMVEDQTQRISQVPLLSTAQRHQLLVEFNDTEADYQSDRLIHELFEEQAARAPKATALVFEEDRLSYEELNRRANQVAHYLIGLGIHPDDRVAICVERSLEMVVGLLGILKAGGAYVPLDPSYPKERLAYMLKDSAPMALLTQTRLRHSFPNVELDVLLLDGADDVSLLAEQSEDNPNAAALGLTVRHLAYVIYTSGSTGIPKGVMVEQRQLVASNAARLLQYPPGERFLLVPSFAFDSSVAVIFWALTTGAALVVTGKDQARDSAALAELVRNNEIDVWLSVPSLYDATLARGGTHQLASLRTVIVAGEELNQAVPERHAREMPGTARLYNEYGPTETCVWSTCDEVFPRQPFPGGSIGRPIANTRVYILDTQRHPVPMGVAGEIYVGGHGVARGYLNQSGLTAERFISDPFSSDSEARAYKTGDLGRWLPNGTIEYLGRNDFQVKIRGFRVELGEIEAKLRKCAGVREAVVIAREDRLGDKRLVAYWTAVEDAELSPGELRDQMASVLPDYMVPSAFVRLAALPLTPNGKLDRQALPAPDQSALSTKAYEATVGRIEGVIAGVWQELLGSEKVGRHDHFFELGGHSLMVITLIERLRQEGLSLDVRTVFLTPTLAALAAALVGQEGLTSAFAVPPNRITPDCTAITPEMLPLVKLTQGEIDQIVASVPGGVANIQDIYPLAPLQEGILFHHLLENGGDAYVLRTILAFDSRDRLDAFLHALQVVIDRHDILRSAVCWRGLTQPVQVVYREAPLQLEELALAGEGDALAQLRARTDRGYLRLSLERAPLLTGYVTAQPQSGEWLMSLLIHHMVSDHVTLDLMLSEIQLLLLGQRDHLPASLPYRNFIAEIHAAAPEVHESYFRRQLGDVDEPTAPFGIINVQGDGTQVEEVRLSLSNDLAQRIRERARERGVTPAVLFHVAWAQVLARCSGSDDVVFGTVLSGRLQGLENVSEVLGMFINTLPIHIPLGTLSIGEVVRDTYQRLSELLEHEQASLALAQRCSGVKPPQPLFTSLLNYRHSHAGGAAQEDNAAVAWEGIRLLEGEERSNYPLALSVTDLQEGFALTAHCGPGIDARRIVNYLGNAIEELAEALGTAPGQPAYRLNILPESERQQLLIEFNATEADYPSDRLIHELFEEQAARSPEATALVFEEERLSYGELNRRANQVAHYLIGLGLRPDERVAICMERSLEMIVGLLGILKAGGAYVPLDSSYPQERLVYMLKDSAPVALLTQTALRDGIASESTLEMPVLLLDGADDLPLLARQSQDNPDPMALGLSSSHLAYVIYTSGSAGLPKGVMNEHRGLCNLVLAQIVLFGVGAESHVLQFASLSFDASISEIMMALCSGAALHLGSREALRPGKALLDTLQRHQITHVTLPSSVLQACAEEELPHSPLTLVAAGEVLPGALACRWASRHQLFNAYGPTEATVCATTYRCGADDESSVPIGRPIANTQIYILDGRLEPVPMGVSGEIYIGGVGVARGYLNRPELTANQFISNPFCSDPAARLYKSGDLGRWLPDGNIEYLGRNDLQVKIRGFRIGLGEIEGRLAACAGVREAVVIGREDNPGEKRLVGYVVPQGDVELSPANLRDELSTVLPEYMVPNTFVILEVLPLTPSGKLDRGALTALDFVRGDVGYVAPRTRTEKLLSVIWSQVLSLDKVGVHDRFCALGGHSLLAVRLFYEINKQLNVTVPLGTILATPTVAMLAIIVETAQRDGQDHVKGV